MHEIWIHYESHLLAIFWEGMIVKRGVNLSGEGRWYFDKFPVFYCCIIWENRALHSTWSIVIQLVSSGIWEGDAEETLPLPQMIQKYVFE